VKAFTYTALSARVVFGAGTVAQLAAEVEKLGAKRALVLSTPGRAASVQSVAASLGTRYAGLYGKAVMHVPIEVAEDARRVAKELGADCCVALGGGSTIGLGKAIAATSGMPVLAVPTTYSGSEMTPIYGLTEQDVEHYAMACASNGSIELFIQPYSVRSALCVMGSTPAADEARFLAQRLQIRLTDTPAQAPVVLIATQGQGDDEALEAALRSPASEVLMIASRRKAEKLRGVMRMRGVDESQLARLQTPAGPDAGAKTPGEIALVAIVGVLALLRGRTQVAVEAKFINPVCGMAVSTVNPMHIEIYEGVSYYFCCDGCWTTFQQDPAKYAAIHHAAVGRVPA